MKNFKKSRILAFMLALVLLQHVALQNSFALGSYKASSLQNSTQNNQLDSSGEPALWVAALAVVGAAVVVGSLAFVAGVLNCVNGGQEMALDQFNYAKAHHKPYDFTAFDS